MTLKIKNIIIFILSAIFLITLFISCEKKDFLILDVTAQASSPVTAYANVTIKSDGMWSITEKGVCWSTHEKPTIDDFRTIDGKNEGDYSSVLTFLEPSTKYYVRAYATFSEGTVYSGAKTINLSYEYIFPDATFTTPAPPPNIIFRTDLIYGTLSDIEGNIYKTIPIGTQIWMVENLKVKKYRNGTDIPNLTDNTKWKTQAAEAYCDYYSPKISNVYGCLYNWDAVNSSNNLCPDGWHIPSDNDWKTLEIALGMPQEEADRNGDRGSNQGTQLKEKTLNSEHWVNFNGGSNTFGFTAIPGGYRDGSGEFKNYGKTGAWWTSTPYNESSAIFRSVSRVKVYRNDINKKNGYSIRCIKD